MTSSYKVMKKEDTLKRELTSEKEWLEGILQTSNSKNSLTKAEVALKAFDVFCKYRLEYPDADISDLEIQHAKDRQLAKGWQEKRKTDAKFWQSVKARRAVVFEKARHEVIDQYTQWFEQSPPDVQSVCASLQKFVRFCSQDHPEVIHSQKMTWKAKKAGTIRGHLSSIKDYLRTCHGIRLTNEDLKDFVKYPKDGKQLREPLDLETVKLLLTYADPTRCSLYYVLLTSGMRLGEGCSLKKSNFNTEVRPIKIHLRADQTKTHEARDTYISEEAWEKLQPIFDATEEGKYLFHSYKEIREAVTAESRYFIRLRKRIAFALHHKEACDEFPEGTGILKRYENSVRCEVQIHAMRAYFMTKASMKHGTDYAHALAGHHTYLDQYIRIPEKQKRKMYLELQDDLLLETKKVHSEEVHEKEVSELREELQEQKAQIEKLQRVDYHRTQFEAENRFGVSV